MRREEMPQSSSSYDAAPLSYIYSNDLEQLKKLQYDMPKVILDIRMYTVAEVAQLLGVTHQTVRNYIKDAKITSKKIGTRHYVTEDNLKKFLEN